MKTWIVVFLFVTAWVAFAHYYLQQPPRPVEESFNRRFPEASGVRWEMESDTEWEADFNHNGKHYSASFHKEGHWLQTEYQIVLDELPEAVRKAVERLYVGYSIREAERVEKDAGIAYELELEKGNEKLEVLFDGEGNLLGSEQEMNDDDD